MRFVLAFLMCIMVSGIKAQDSLGVVIGNVLDEKSRALEGATVQLVPFSDSGLTRTQVTDPDGAFQFSHIPFGYYRLRFSYVGLQSMTLDSIYFRAERFDFNLNDVILKPQASSKLEEVVIYAEKPIIQSKDGNITFNAGESALSAGSNASDLLTSVPLITKDPSGKVLVRGKEPKILIDDKPVELNLDQLQDLLESMPGSSIERIEVMTNPPPQYASEQGGVINIITKKGSVGMSGRLSVYAGTRGEAGGNGSFNYRKQGFSLNINAGTGANLFEGTGNSSRHNIYTDSSSYFNTTSRYNNKNMRPNFRMNMNYDLNKFHSFNLVLQYNQNDFDNRNITGYTNVNRNAEIYRMSERTIRSTGHSYNPNVGLSYSLKTKKPGESLKLITNYNHSSGGNTRDFYQQYFLPDHTPTGYDSTQQQVNDSRNNGYSLRLNYDLPLSNLKTFLSFGTYYTVSRSNVQADATYLRSSDHTWVPLEALQNEFLFSQYIRNLRASVKQLLGENFSATAGMNAEETRINFDFFTTGGKASNRYWSFLPFATLNRSWKEVMNLSFSYRRSIRRPGINELNPTIDFSDPYNIRFGNPDLIASLAHNFDLVVGKTKTGFYANLGLGYNIVEDIFAQVRTLQPDGKTQVTWENISGRKEYEVSTWSGYTLNKHTRVNFSASYSYNTYSAFDKLVRKYRDGGSITSHLNANYTLRDIYMATGSFTFNRFANPQGTVKSSLRMNIGLQAKLLQKKLTATINIIDPFLQQENRSLTYGRNFTLESFSATQTRNFRLSLAYNFSRKPKKKAPPARQQLQQLQKKING